MTISNFKKGFTLIEIIVVMAVFMFIIGAGIGLFLSIVKSQKRILAEQQLINQISYAEEYMSKALRMAVKDSAGTCLTDDSPTSPNFGHYYTNYNYLLTRPINNFFTGIKFINASNGNICQEFFLDTDGVLYERKKGVAQVPLTSSNMKVNFVRFGINGYNGCYGGNTCPSGDQDTAVFTVTPLPQPRITTLLNVTAPGDSNGKTFQTTVSQRNLNTK
ncbi:MAG: type II secretion system protein [Candidatus Staskawiczbacteria bacterium]|nr:type II secretion system protein [Candidatus Staskawiczbacteria bacterium]